MQRPRLLAVDLTGPYEVERNRACFLEQFAISDKVGHPQGQVAMLPYAQHVTGSPEQKVGLGDRESIGVLVKHLETCGDPARVASDAANDG